MATQEATLLNNTRVVPVDRKGQGREVRIAHGQITSSRKNADLNHDIAFQKDPPFANAGCVTVGGYNWAGIAPVWKGIFTEIETSAPPSTTWRSRCASPTTASPECGSPLGTTWSSTLIPS